MPNSILDTATEANISVSANTTRYFPLAQCNTNNSATESTEQITYRVAGKVLLSHIVVRINSVTASSTFGVRKNSSNGNISINILASTTGEFVDITNTDAVVPGDIINYFITTGATGTTMLVGSLSSVFNADIGSLVRCASIISNNVSANSTTKYFPISALFDGNLYNESSIKAISRTNGALQNGYINISANARTSTTTFGTRISGSNGNLVINVGAGLTGIFEDITNKDSITSAQFFSWYITTGTGASEIITISQSAIDFVGKNNNFLFYGGSTSNTINSATTDYLTIGGDCRFSSNGNETFMQIRSQLKIKSSNLFVNVGFNSIPNDSTLRLRLDGVNANQIVTITASTTGTFEDITNADIISENQKMNYSFITGAGGGSLQKNVIDMLAEVLVSRIPPINSLRPRIFSPQLAR